MGQYVKEKGIWYWISDDGKKWHAYASDTARQIYQGVVARAMQAADKLRPGNALTKRAQTWKKTQGIISLTIDELEKKVTEKGLKLIAEQKVDGQSALMDYSGGKTQFGSLGGRIFWDLPVLQEIESILKRAGVKHAVMVGEMAAMEGRKITHFDKTESIIKHPQADKGLIHWFPYQILVLDDEKFGEDYDTYTKNWPRLKSLFKNSSHVHPVKSYEGGAEDLRRAWKILVEDEENEGLVVRTSDGKVYKCKPEFTYDLVVVAVGDKKKKNWPKGMVGTTLMAFMDKDRVFRVAGEVGAGLTQAESRELFQWAKKNSVGEDDHHTWVKPQKIMEVQYERSTIKDVPSYRYERGRYEKIEKRLGGTIVKPRFIRWRTDKSASPSDLRLTQIPDWSEREKTAHRVIAGFLAR